MPRIANILHVIKSNLPIFIQRGKYLHEKLPHEIVDIKRESVKISHKASIQLGQWFCMLSKVM